MFACFLLVDWFSRSRDLTSCRQLVDEEQCCCVKLQRFGLENIHFKTCGVVRKNIATALLRHADSEGTGLRSEEPAVCNTGEAASRSHSKGHKHVRLAKQGSGERNVQSRISDV